jgi:hypothetical protein
LDLGQEMKLSKPGRYQIAETLISASLLISLLAFSNLSAQVFGLNDAHDHQAQQ